MTFGDVMDRFPFERLWELLNNPKPIGRETMFYVAAWMRPQVVNGGTIVDVMFAIGVASSKSELRRKIASRSIKWNGRTVDDPEMIAEFLEPGWGVVQSGKKWHDVVVLDARP